MTDRTMPDAHPLRSGDPIRLGGYEILGRLGEGGQGAVFLGRHAGANASARPSEHVAIKLLHGGLTGDESARARFVRELEVAKRVARFCTAQVLDADVAGDQPYIVSEYVPGLSLAYVVREEGPRTGGALERLAISTLTALTAIHQAGIVHRDFKPHNVMMGPDGPRVIDFGVARALGAAGETQNVGTPAYMAPEHFSGGEVGPASDMFAWGTTMVFAATGRPAFGNDEMATVMNRILTSEPDLGDLSGPMRDLVLACLAKEPSQRPTAREAQERLVGAASGTSSVDAPVPPLPAFPGLPVENATPGHPGTTDPNAPPSVMAGAFLPPDNVTDPAAPQNRTAVQPQPYGEMTPQPSDAPYGLPPVPPGPLGSSYTQPTGGGKRGRLVPIAAAIAVAAVVVGGGAVWAATRSSGDDHSNQGVEASDKGPGAGNGSAGAGGDTGSANGPGKPKQPGQGKQQGQGKGQDPIGPSKKPGGGQQQPGGGTSPTKGTGGGGGGTTPVNEPPNKYTPQQACGSGYNVQRSVAGSGGVAYLLYSNSTKKNCAVTMKTKNVGKASAVSVWLQAKGRSRTGDSGSFAWYAGPVYVSAPGVCVRFGGNGATAPYGNCG
ncbi:serine/threonine protein kinase [Actinomadura verrucosospora]|uniref:non-specific serine/threonine protein kinase n=1 Tax=Actinomadura verrucosospora TaxID=46165 RepID=A0A7D4AQ74_ACTVE|nr:serine/threonine-protein kinase [Actinomadura verrucosospora]QKG22449.1 serine/threonine protein kinase-like protein [Actinomadura verrucosospora]